MSAGVAAAMALACYVSANPSPKHWLVSGGIDAVAWMDALIAPMTEVRRVVHAVDGDIAFSRYELGADPPNRVMFPMITGAQRDGLVISRFQHIVPSCPDGLRSQTRDSRSNEVVGLIGPDAAIARLNVSFSRTYPIQLEDGRTGVGLALNSLRREDYDPLLRRAAEGTLGGVDLVLMQPR